MQHSLIHLCSQTLTASSNRGAAQAVPKKNNVRNGGLSKSKDDECFGERTDEDLDTDFDFEGNLALFDKAAVFSQIDGTSSHSSRAQRHGTQAKQKQLSYRHDENILEGDPFMYQQIKVPQHGCKEYCTGENKMQIHVHTVVRPYR